MCETLREALGEIDGTDLEKSSNWFEEVFNVLRSDHMSLIIGVAHHCDEVERLAGGWGSCRSGCISFDGGEFATNGITQWLHAYCSGERR